MPLFGRPTAAEIKVLWNDFDLDRNDYLGRVDKKRFLSEVAARWGGGDGAGGVLPAGWEELVSDMLGSG